MDFRLTTIATWLFSTAMLLPATAQDSLPNSTIDLDPQLLQSSPVLQRWRDRVPNIQDEIQRDPSFRTRVRVGYSQFRSNKSGKSGESGGWNVGVEEVLLDRSGFTLSADYQATFNRKQESWGADLRYYVGPLGSSVNLAPVVGYRYLETDRYAARGINVGARLLLVPSRTGAAEISLTQTWVSPGSAEEVSLTGLSFGYAVTRNLRLSTDIQRQRSRDRRDDRFGIGLEWML
ncbi:MAG TPA: hypothetical protein V6D18_05465 [Thermosynechococcaceae cyanobacterium]